MKSYYRVLADIKSKYDIDIVAGEDTLGLALGYSEAAPTTVRDYVEFFLHKELSVYTNDVIRKSKVGRIVLCKNVAKLGKLCNGAAEMKVLQLPFWKNTIYLNVQQSRSAYDRATIHHELFHAIDFHDDCWRYTDLEWPKLNTKDFQYGTVSYAENSKHTESGFISVHGTSAVYEDKADLYAHMLVNYSGVEKQAASDPIIKSKMARMKELLRKFCPEYDDEFWQRRAAVSVDVY
jgi:hypothetical protein